MSTGGYVDFCAENHGKLIDGLLLPRYAERLDAVRVINDGNFVDVVGCDGDFFYWFRYSGSCDMTQTEWTAFLEFLRQEDTRARMCSKCRGRRADAASPRVWPPRRVFLKGRARHVQRP